MNKDFIREISREELKGILGGTKTKETKDLNEETDADLMACAQGCREGCKDSCKSCSSGQTGGGDTILKRSYPLLNR